MGTRREKILQKLNPKLLKMTPKLSGDVGSFIDLDSDNSLEDGAKNLMIRFLRNQDLCEKNKRNSRENVTELTISCAKYSENNEICELISERLTLPFVKNDAEDVNERPGKGLQRLKMELQEKMSAKWEEEYKKRVSENKIYSGSTHKYKKKISDEDDFNSEKEIGLEDEESDGDTKEDPSDEEFGDDEDGLESDAASTASEELLNEETCEKSESDKPEEDDNDYDSADGCSLVPAYQPGGGMLYGGSELTQCDEGLPQNLLSPSLRLSITESPTSTCKLSSEFQGLNDGTPKKAQFQEEEVSGSFTEMNKLFSQNPNESFDLNEAFEFCSGKFPEASASQLRTKTQENVEEYDDNSCESSEKEEHDEKSQSSSAEIEQDTSKKRKNIIAFEDSDVEEEDRNDVHLKDAEESQSAIPELLSDDEEEVDAKQKRRKKQKQTLHFSDEEDSVNDSLDVREQENLNSEAINDRDDDDNLESGDELEQRSVHYDSEENEIINPKEFFEKEAELSGSEWSGDEDERGLDEFDVEEGDADKIDDDQVRSQLEKIHIRRVLDDDAREVRLIQEILFEDGDLHSDGKRRDRKFKWKNLGTFDENLNEGERNDEGDCSSEDDGAMEEELRKIRHEKELFLMTKKKSGDVSSDEEIIEDFHSVKVTSVKASLKPTSNVEILDSSKVVGDYTRTAISVCNTRGSFLTRNEQFLSRLAKATLGVTDNVLGPKSSKNFVFATKSPEKKDLDKSTVSKRQIEDSGSCRRDKKIKLVLPEMDKEPSILDLLV